MPIEISNRQTRTEIKITNLRKTAEKILSALACDYCTLSITILDDDQIQKINQKHLGHDYPTDVISFPQFQLTPPSKPPKEDESIPIQLGDIVISAETASKQAVEAEHDLESELNLLICHGVLHLLGYEDKTTSGATTMSEMQDEILKDIGHG